MRGRVDSGKWLFFAGTVFLAFIAGTAAGLYNWLPAHILGEAQASLGVIKSNVEQALTQTPIQHLSTRHHPRDGVLRADSARMAPGVTLVSGLFGQVLGFRLFGADGQILYVWPIDFFAIAPEKMEHRYHALIHGERLYPNGDIVANLDGRGMVRFDRCGKVVWQNDSQAHHSVFADDAGQLWAPVAGPYYEHSKVVRGRFRLDQVGVFDPDTGKEVRRIDIVAALERSDMPGLIQENQNRNNDVGHLNDVEVLGIARAPSFPMFSAGDILLSFRNLNQLWVLDGRTERIKWVGAGPLVGQHDPDFQKDGTISALDNHPRDSVRSENGYPGPSGGSRIVTIDPVSHDHRVAFASAPEHPFYTPYRGKHQRLENGNLLIAETDAGRAFEVTEAGEIVWEYVNGWDDAHVGWIMGAERYPAAWGDFAAQPCPARTD